GQFGRNVAGLTTPSAPSKEASRYWFDVASTPPLRGGEWPAPFFSWLDNLRTVIICRVAVKRVNVIGAVADWRIFNDDGRTLDPKIRSASVACCTAPGKVRIR